MKLMLRDVNQDVCDMLDRYFIAESSVDVKNQSIFDERADAIVSPANSFGFMDGGIDYLYLKHFGEHLQGNVQDAIKDLYDGEVLVGQAFVVETGASDFPYMIVAPTMRVPEVIKDATAIRLAMKAAMKLALDQGFKKVACPGLGMGSGFVKPPVGASAMWNGYNDAIRPSPFPVSSRQAWVRHQM